MILVPYKSYKLGYSEASYPRWISVWKAYGCCIKIIEICAKNPIPLYWIAIHALAYMPQIFLTQIWCEKCHLFRVELLQFLHFCYGSRCELAPSRSAPKTPWICHKYTLDGCIRKILACEHPLIIMIPILWIQQAHLYIKVYLVLPSVQWIPVWSSCS